MSSAPLVRQHTDRGVAVLTLDSPHNRNALSAELVGQLSDALDEAGRDDGVRAVLIGHEGPAFCSGADLKAGDIDKGPQAVVDLMRRIVALPRPVVARVDGHARAGGIGLIAACDIAVAGHGATFAFTESRLGLAPSVISLPILARADRRAVARYFLTGERFGPEEAQRIGLVSGTADELHGILAGLRAASPQGLAASKELTTGPLLRALDEAGPVLAAESGRLFASEEAALGIRAALERRDPPWAL